MGWDQSNSAETVSSFLQRLVGIDADFIAKEVRRRMEARGLEIVKVETIEESDGFNDFSLQRITMNDGRIFVHRCVKSECSDDWGADYYEFRDEKENTKCDVVSYCE